jgi:hypothetical protein
LSRGKARVSWFANALHIEHSGQITGLNRHMFHWERALNHRDDHAAVVTGVQIPMGGICRHEHGFPSLERSVIVTHDDDPFTFPAERDLIGNRMTMQAVLLAGFEAVNVAMKVVGLPDPPSHKPSA